MPALMQQIARASQVRSSSLTCAPSATLPLNSAVTRLFLVVLCATRLVGITHHSLWYDEGYTLNLVNTHSFSQFLQIFSSYTMSEHLQPLYYLFLYGWSRFAGTGDLAMRLPSALFSIASGFIFLSLMEMLTPKRNGLGVALLTLFSVSSYSIYFAQEARPYAMLQMLSLAFIALWLDQRHLLPSIHEPRSRFSRAAFCAVAALCAVGSAFTAMLVLCVCIAEFTILRSARRWWTVWGMPMAACGIVLAVYLAVLRHLHVPGDVRDFVVLRQSLWMNIPYVFSGLIFGSTLPPGPQALHGPGKMHALLSAWPVLALCLYSVVFTVLALYGLLRAPKGLPTLTNTFARATALYMLLLFAGFGWIGRLNVLPRHGSALFAMLFVLVLLASIPRWKADHRWRPVYAYALTGVLVCNLISVWEYFGNPEFLKDDYRATAELTLTHQHMPVFLVQGQPVLLEHYGAIAIDATEVEPTDLAGFIQHNAGSRGPVRLLTNKYRGYRWDHAGSVASVLAARYDCHAEARFSYMDVDVCSPRADGLHAQNAGIPLARTGTGHGQ